MKHLRRPRSFRNKISSFSRGWLTMRLGLSCRPPLKQVRPNARLENTVQGMPEIGTEFLLADLLDVNAELPYSTVVEGLEEFLYQSELQPRAYGVRLR